MEHALYKLVNESSPGADDGYLKALKKSFGNLSEMIHSEFESEVDVKKVNICYSVFKCHNNDRMFPLSLEYFYVDLDDIEIEKKNQYVLALGGFLSVDPDSIAVIFTGRGLQCFVKLDQEISTEDFKYKRSAYCNLAYKFKEFCASKSLTFKVDTSVYSSVRVLRYPNTVNHNPTKKPEVANSFVLQPGDFKETKPLADLLKLADYNEDKVKNFELNYEKLKGKKFKGKKCIELLWNKPLLEQRHHTFLRLCSHERFCGTSFEECKLKVENLCKISGFEPTFRGYSQLKFCYKKKPYDYGCNDEILKSVCSVECFLHPEKVQARKEQKEKSIADDFYSVYYDNGKEIKKPEYYYMGEHFLNKYKLKCFEAYNYIYNGKFYEQISDRKIENMIMELTEDYEPGPIILSCFLKITKVVCFSSDQMGEFGSGLINLNNGVFNVKTGELTEHSHEYSFVNCLPYDYVKGAQCPRFDKFLNQIMLENKELVQTIYEFIGYTLLGGDPYLHKALVCFGEGSNGKSTLVKVMAELFGSDNCSTVKPNELKQRFQTANLLNKIANINEEFSADKIESDYFKEIIGGAEITSEYKGKQMFKFKNTARFIICTNQMPVFSDTTKGMMRRLIMIPFDYEIQENDYNFNIHNELKEELPGIFNACILALKQLSDRGKFLEVKASKDVIDEYKFLNDSVYEFQQLRIVLDKDSAVTYKTERIYASYVIFCTETGSYPVKKRSFEIRLSRHLKSRCKEENFDFNLVKNKGIKNNFYSKIKLLEGGF